MSDPEKQPLKSGEGGKAGKEGGEGGDDEEVEEKKSCGDMCGECTVAVCKVINKEKHFCNNFSC